MRNPKGTAIKALLTLTLALLLGGCAFNMTSTTESNVDTAIKTLSDDTEIKADTVTPLNIADAEENETKAETVKASPESGEGADWHEKYPIVAHALGTVAGRTETNCREAFIESYENGQRVFEADFMLTSDGKLVVRHDFDDNSYYNLEQSPGAEYVMDYNAYMSSKIRGLYTPLDADGLCALLAEYPDAYLVTDSKATDKATVEREFKLLAEAVEKTDKSIFSRTVVQIYYEEMLDIVAPLYQCGGWIFTLYQISDPDYNAVAEFCAEKGVDVVTLDRDRFSANVAEILHSRGIKLYTHTVNRSDSMFVMYTYGCDGFYSDYITPSDWEAIKNNKMG